MDGEKEYVIMHMLSGKEGSVARINLMLINEHYSYVKRSNSLLYDYNRHNESKHFCERCLHGYSRKDLLERHKPKCMGHPKGPRRTEMLKKGENKVKFNNYYKQMKALFTVYTDLKSLIRKIHGYMKKGQATVKT